MRVSFAPQVPRLAAAVALFALAPAVSRAQCADPVPPSPNWKASIDVATYDPFAGGGAFGEPRWFKFVIRACDTTEVHFQDARPYPFHVQFATAEVPPFVGMTVPQFDDVSLHAAGQQAILGAVLVEPSWSAQPPEIGIQLVRRDPYPSDVVRDLYQLVLGRVTGYRAAFYMPTPEQRGQAEADRAYLEANGITIGSPDRWVDGNACYAMGWGLGRLVYVPTAEIQLQWMDGRLLPTDVLLTDSVPAEVPPVAGIASLEPGTPSSHVAILAQTWGIPYAYLRLPEERARALAFVGQRVILRTDAAESRCRAKVILVDGRVDEPLVQELLALKAPRPLAYRPVERLGAWSADTTGLGFSDIHHFGGKASSFGLLRRTIPASSPVATAFSFDLWLGFMDQTLGSGLTLREEIAQRLAPHRWPPDMRALSLTLQGIRDLVKDAAQTSFTPEQQAAVFATLQDPRYGFDPMRNLRFRSSTNVEDAEDFTGAGLHDSFSGCLADDQDADAVGPSLCDATELNERGVFRAIRKVFASFYNDNAYLERLRHGVVEDEVGMALLVHHSFPDDVELANGVAVLRRPRGAEADATLVTQAGAVSVSNPAGPAVPEVVQVFDYGFGVYPEVEQYSDLVQLGATVMTWEDDYQSLFALLTTVGQGYAAETGEASYKLDFEYKKLAPDGRLEVKQVRRLPLASTETVTPFLVNDPVDVTLDQAEGGMDGYAHHRLKSRWRLETLSGWLTSDVLARGFLAGVRHELTDGCSVRVEQGPWADRPGASHDYDASTFVSRHSWSQPDLPNPRTVTLELSQAAPTAPADNPIRTLADLGWGRPSIWFTAVHAAEVTGFDWMTGDPTRADDAAVLRPERLPAPDDSYHLFTFDDPGTGLSIETRYWMQSPDDTIVIWTAPLVRFDRTTITGLTTQPIVLTSYWSQSFLPYHHNFGAQYVFDPRLDPATTAAQRAELAALGVRAVHVDDTGSPVITLLGDELWGAACAPCVGEDLDLDGRCTGGPSPDCDDGDGSAWSTPGEALDLRFVDEATLAWSAPADAGGAAVLYDTLRSTSPASFAGACLERGGTDRTSVDPATPGAGRVFFYLVRATNACPSGLGDLGRDSLGRQRAAPACP